MSYSQLRMKHEEKNKQLEKNRILLRYAYGFVLLAFTAVYFSDDKENHLVKRNSSKISIPASIPLQKNEVFIEEVANENYAHESQEYTELLDEISGGINNLNENIANKKLKFDCFAITVSTYRM